MEGTVRTLGNKIDSVNQSLRKQRATLEAKNTDLSQRDAAIQGLEKQVRERNKSIKEPRPR